MNIALPAILLFFLVAPGFLYHHYSQAREAREADMTPFGATAIKSIVLALIVDAAVGLAATEYFGYQLYLGDALRMLSGGTAAASVPPHRYEWLNEHPWPVFGFFAGTFGLAFALAMLRRWLVSRFHLDHPNSWASGFFRQQAPWYYLFSGIDSGISDGAMVVVSAVVPMKDQSYLYTGLLEDFEFKSDGELERIILSAASRRKLTDDRGRGLEEHGRFYPIEGNRLVIRSTEWTTLNVKFLVEEKAEASAPALADD
ncbi:DUF6338 family protein [Cupriavidus gilardii]|uniref:DUF6338 family protein n=1 Tax=Cupriavidus gilardii TaxID=82541 RepID=UPI0007E36370|nr:DUF6338 family protein [Cupriavidus gilardii]